MSQRSGPPKDYFSAVLLKLVSWICCLNDENEWDGVWSSRHDMIRPVPVRASPYKGARIIEQIDARWPEHLDYR